MLWLGAAAVIVGIIGLMVPINFTVALIIWAVLSALFIYLWHQFISPRLIDRTTAGLSREAIVGQVGMVTFYDQSEGRGRIKFPAPIVGNDEWEFIYSEPLANGDKVQVIDLSGNSLIVQPYN